MVSIEKLEPDGFEMAAAWLSNPDINRWFTGEWRGRTVKPQMVTMAVRNKANLIYVIKNDSQSCGLVCLADIDPADRVAMIWYILGEEGQRGKGIATEAVKLMVRLAFSQLSMACVYAWIMRDNNASKRVLEKAGFQEAGHLRSATTSAAAQVDRVYFDLIESDTRPSLA